MKLITLGRWEQKEEMGRKWHSSEYIFLHNFDLWNYANILYVQKIKSTRIWGFPGGAVVKNLPANAGDTGSSPGPGRSHMLQSN